MMNHRAIRAGAVATGVLALLATACSSDDGGTPSGPATPLEITAVDIAFEPDELSVSTGNVEITLVQAGQAPHNLVVEGRPEIRLEVGADNPGDVDVQTYEFEAGRYTFFCDVPGHRQAGMEGTLTVTES